MIENLLRAVPPPRAPFEAFSGPWEPLEAELGTPLPPDYKAFVRLYGSGYFMRFLGVTVPRSHNPNTRFEHRLRRTCEVFEAFDDEDRVFPLWPNPGGLLPFGGTDNGDELFWLPQGTPEDWKVVVWDRGMMRFEVLDCDLTDFLAGLATGAMSADAFPELLPCEHMFQSGARHLRYHMSWRTKGRRLTSVR
jgi:hypothetical protein